MTYSIVQAELMKPAKTSLRTAFKALSGLVDMDAHVLGNDGYGVLVSDLSRDNAACLREALRREGIETEVVADEDLVRLPPPIRVRRIDCRPRQLTYYDILGRPREVPWQHVVIAAAGFVSLREFERRDIMVSPIRLTSITVLEQRRARLVLDIIMDIAPWRIELLGHEGQYNYLASRMSPRFMQNFALTVQDLANFAETSLRNRGAESLRRDTALTFHYPSRHAFEEEMTWLLWHKMRVAKEQHAGRAGHACCR